ncbi:TolC family outer membrane protein [Methylosoma difficile]
MTFKQLALGACLAWLCAAAQAQDLMGVYQDAAQADPQLEQAKEALAAVQESKQQAEAALYLPEAHLSANVYGDTQAVQLSQDSTGVNGRSNFIAGGYVLSLTQPILHYDRLLGVDQSDRQIAQAEADYAAAEIGLLAKVAERYFQALAAQENRGFTQSQQNTIARELQETQQFHKAGFVALTDVKEAQAAYDRAVADSLSAEHDYNDALEALQELTGIHYQQNLSGLREDLPLVEPQPNNEDAWLQQALKQNYGLIASEQSLQAAKTEIERQQAGHLPTLDAVGNHSFSTSGGRFGTADIQDTAVGLTLNIPLYQGGQTQSKVRSAEHHYRALQAKLKQEQRAVHRATSQAFLGVTAGISRVKALAQTVQSSQAAVAATQAGFSVGRRTALDVIIAERECLRSQRDFAKARYDYLLSTLHLKQHTGILSAQDLAQLNQWLVGH